jgi:hypothetical protein
MSFALAFAIGLSGVQSYPVAEVLGAAQRACEAILGDKDAAKALVSSGWTPVEPMPDSWIAKDIEESAKFWAGVPTARYNPPKVYGRILAGRALFSFANSIVVEEGTFKSCTVQNRDAKLDGAGEVRAWARRSPVTPTLLEPALQQAFDRLHFTLSWKPGLHESAQSTAIRYMSTDNGGDGLLFISERLIEQHG